MENRIEHLIESYFSGSLTEAEALELKKTLAADADAAREFAWQKQVAGQVSKLSLAGSIEKKTWKEAARPPFRKVSMWPRLLAAAATVALLAVAYIFLPKITGSGSEDSIAGNFQHFPNKMKFKNLGENNATQEELEAFALYDKFQYKEAALKLAALCEKDPSRIDWRFYQGVSLAGSEQYPKAVETLLPIANDATSSFAAAARFYLGLSYAAVNNSVEARKYLEAYVQGGGENVEQAQNLLKKLK